MSSDDFARISAKNRHMYEVILGDLPRQLYFDFEVYDRGLEEAADVLNEIRNTIAKHFGDIHLAISGSVATVTRDGEEKVKHSYHVTCPDIVYANWQEQQENLHDFVEFYKKDGFDPAVYGRTSQLMKMVGQSKRGDPRVQVIVQDDVRENHFITAFLKEGAGPAKPRDVPQAEPSVAGPSRRRGRGDAASVDLAAITPVPFVAEIPPSWDIRKSPISEALKLMYHDDGANRLDRTTRYVILKWIQTRGGTFEDFLGFMRGGRPLTCDKIEKYQKEWDADTKGVKDNTIMAILRVLHPAVEFGNKQLREHRRYHDVKPTNYVSAARQFTVPEAFDGEMGRPGRSYVSGQDLTECKVDIWALPLGSGKTSGMLDIIKSNPAKRVLIVTCRKTLVSDIFGRALAEGLSAVQYLDVKDKATMGSHNFLRESLHYLADAKPYDIIFCDEWESFMNTWLSRDTHKDKMRANWDTFMTLWECAKKIVLMDAFVTRKSTEFMEIMGDEYRILGSRHSAPTRTLQYIQFPTLDDFHMRNDARLTAVVDLVVTDLRAGKNIFMFYPYKDGTESMLSIRDLRTWILMSTGIDDRDETSTVYFGDQDDVIKNGLKRTERAFAGKRLIISNSCITVGVSYTGGEFDKMYIVRPNFVGVRDIIQFSYRTRSLRENTVVVADIPTKSHELVFSGDSSRMAKAKHLDDAFQLLERYAEFEKKTTSEDIMRHYAGLAGYQVVDVDYKLHPITARTNMFIEKLMLDNTHESERTHITWESVTDIDRRELNTRKEMQANNEPLTYAQKLSIRKWFFRDLFTITTPTQALKEIWEERQGIKIAHCVTNFVRNEWQHARYLTPARLGELKAFFTGGIDDIKQIAPFTESERNMIRKEYGLASFTPGRRCCNGKLISVLLDHLFGVALISRSPVTKRYEHDSRMNDLVQDVYRYMRMPNDEEYGPSDRECRDDEDVYYQQKRLRVT